MQTINELITYCHAIATKYPELKEQLQDTFELAVYEIQDGESETHEVELAVGYIDELIDELIEDLK